MKRRAFLALSGASLTGYLISIYKNRDFSRRSNLQFPLHIIDSPAIPHQIKTEIKNFKITKTIKAQTLIIGGGVAGLAAFDRLKKSDVILCESFDRLGGTASSYELNSFQFPTGAHYIPEFPTRFGQRALNYLVEKNIIKLSTQDQKYEFIDSQFYVKDNFMQLADYEGEYFNDSELPIDDRDSHFFLEMISQYNSKLCLPTYDIEDKKIQALSNQTFAEFLAKSKINLSQRTLDLINYRMHDDYGDSYQNVCAFSGLTHFAGRPINQSGYKTYCHPAGNGFFAQKILSENSHERFLTGHTVVKINETNAFETIVIGKNGEYKSIITDKIIYAANKHSLKYTMPKYADLFQNNRYAPWLVIGFLIKPKEKFSYYWQNEIIKNDDNFLGFSIKEAYNGKSYDANYITASVYFNFGPNQRQLLLEILNNPQPIIELSLKKMERHLKQSLENQVDSAFIKAHGHAMAITQPGFLFNDANQKIKNTNFAFAGCDNSRLPLFFEAIDSGLVAANIIKE